MNYLPSEAIDPVLQQETLSHSRADVITAIKKQRHFDLIVIGGGIHGAALARLAAFNGLSTALFERADYASATSSRSSKMAHGGLRYLEMLDFRQVFEGIKAREDLFDTADHLVQAHQFLLPIKSTQQFLRWKLALGLTLYDFFITDRSRRHRFTARQALSYQNFTAADQNLLGAFLYTDGIMNDTRLVLENITAARQEGALCLNYAEVISVSQSSGGEVGVGWRDLRTGANYEAVAGIAVNCAGPWVGTAGRLTPGPLQSRIVYSQGSHILFSKPWNDPPTLFPMGGGRAYWVWPHPTGTLVGTTEREVPEALPDPLPQPDEIDEILDRLHRDLPRAEFSRDNAHYCFAGTRTLVKRESSSTSKLSRRHEWHYHNGLLSLLGGKFTTAYWTALDGLKEVYKLASLDGTPTSLQGRSLPGAGLDSNRVSEFKKAAQSSGISPALIQRALRLYGSRADEVLKFPQGSQSRGESYLQGELDYALKFDQAETLEDLMRRRLDLEYFPGNGVDHLPQVLRTLKSYRPEIDLVDEEQRYRSRMKRIQDLLKA